MRSNVAGPRARSRFRSNVARIVGGTVASQAIVIAATPLLTRLYGPEDFGALALFTALHAVIACVFTLKYELAIILPRDDAKAVDLTVLTVVVSMLFGLALFLALAASRSAFGAPSHTYLLLLPLSAVLGGAYTAAQQWNARANDYRPYARGQVVNSLVNATLALALAMLTSQALGGMVVAYVAGLAAGVLYLARSASVRRSDGDLHQALQPARWLAAAREYRRFPMFVLPSSFMATLALSAQPFVLQSLFQLRDVGHYAIANRFLMIPSALVGGAVSEAFRAEFVERLKSGADVRGFFRRTLARLGAIAVPTFLAFFVVAPMLFAWLFGDEYRRSGELARHLCIGVLAQFVSQPFGYVFVATGRMRTGLAIQTAVTAVPLVGTAAGGLWGGLETGLALYSALALVACTLLVALAYRCCPRAGVDVGEVRP